MEKEKVLSALKQLRENEKRKFSQSVDLIINLKSFDVKKESVNLFLQLPHKIKDVKICAFLNKKSSIVDSITRQDFDNYDKKKIKKLVKEYDFFVSSANLMPAVASAFGKYLGPAGKMPSPQLGIIKEENEKEIREILSKFENIIKVKSKEPSLKFSIGKENMKDEEIAENVTYAYNTILDNLPKKKENMKDEEIAENVTYAYNTILDNLPKKKENLKNVMIKFTMSKPVKLEI